MGFDFSADMIATARENHRGKGNIRFQQGDMRRDLPKDAFDLYFSCGVPYSHLSTEDFRKVLTGILRTVRRGGGRTALVIDVLGRYSLEWCSNWGEDNWMYRMSFFKSAVEERPTRMFFYDRTNLENLVREAAALAKTDIAELLFFDRSIGVGRHTSTGDYHAGLAPLRDLVNSLYEESCATNLDDLLLDLELPGVTPGIDGFIRDFVTAWNVPVRQAIALTRQGPDGVSGLNAAPPLWLGTTTVIPDKITPAVLAKVLEPALAEELRRIEWSKGRGLGAGHSLIAVAHLS